jgi:hypothetical protein
VREQAPVAGADVERASSALGQLLEQHALALGAMRELLGALEIAPDVHGVGPLAVRHPRIIAT